MKIAFYGGETAGYISLLALLAKKYLVTRVYAEDEKIQSLAKLFKIPHSEKSLLDESNHIRNPKNEADLLVCCHARKILKKYLIDTIPSINLHPCLYAYKGGHPIQRLIAEKNSRASVACHWMIEKVDAGEVIVERFIQIKGVAQKSEAEVYNELYPLYTQVLIESLEKLESSRKK